MDEQEIKHPIEDGTPVPAKQSAPMPKPDVASKDSKVSDVFEHGETINDSYVIDKLIGRGGMGEIYRAKDIVLGTDVAIKVVSKSFGKDNSYALDMLRNEAKKSASLRHKNIVSVLGLKHEERKDVWYVIMEFIDGGSLHSILDRQQVVSEEQAVIIVEEIANALNVAAELKIAHRDIKPDNIMFTSRGEVKLADLGIARHYGSGSLNSTRTVGTGFNAGTLAYTAPEQLLNPDNYDIRSDIYSLGVTFYEMLTGQTPFAGSPTELREKILNTPAPDPRKINPEISEWCGNLVLRMLEKDPAKRFSTPKELIETIDKEAGTFNVLQREELMEKLVAGEHATVIDSKTSWPSSKFTEGKGATLLFKVSMAVMLVSLALCLAFAGLLVREWRAKQEAAVQEANEKGVAYNFKITLNDTATNARTEIVNLLEHIVRRIDFVMTEPASPDSKQSEIQNEEYNKSVFDAREIQKRLADLSEKRNNLPESDSEEIRYKDEAAKILGHVQKELNVALDVQEKVSNAGKTYWALVNGDKTAHDALEEISSELNEIKRIATEIESDAVKSRSESELELVEKVRSVETSLEKAIKVLETKFNDKPKPEEPKAEEPKAEEPKPEEPKAEEPDDANADAEKAAAVKALVDEKVKIIREAYNSALEKKKDLGNVGDLDKIDALSSVVAESRKTADDALAALNASGYDAARLKELQDEAKALMTQLMQWGALADFMKKANASLKAASTRAYSMMKAKDAKVLEAEFKAASDAIGEIDKMRRALKVEAMPEVTIYANEAGLLKQDIDCVRTILECHLQARKLFEDIKDKSSVDDGFRIDEGFKKCFNTIKERKKEADTAVLDMNKGDLRNKAEELIGDVGEWEKAMLCKPSDDFEAKAMRLLIDSEARNKALERAKDVFSKDGFEFKADVFKNANKAMEELKRAMEGIGETLDSKGFELADDSRERMLKRKNDFEKLCESLANNANDFADKAKVERDKADGEMARLGKQSFQWIDEEDRKKSFGRMENAIGQIRVAIEYRDFGEKWWKERCELIGLQRLLDVMSQKGLSYPDNTIVLVKNQLNHNTFCKALDSVCKEIDSSGGESAAELLASILKNLSSFRNKLEKDYKAYLARTGDDEKRYKTILEKLESIEEKIKR
ncbi:MAG: protein kinase [Victivallales bacterium]|nr:protein kinase [Victivallales bacterium]